MDASGRYKLVRPDMELALRGVRVLVGGPQADAPGALSENPDVEARVKGFLEYARYAHIDITRQVLAIERQDQSAVVIAGMCLWVPAPGRTGMIFGPNQSEFPQ